MSCFSVRSRSFCTRRAATCASNLATSWRSERSWDWREAGSSGRGGEGIRRKGWVGAEGGVRGGGERRECEYLPREGVRCCPWGGSQGRMGERKRENEGP